MNAQHICARYSESFKVLGPLDQGNAVLLSLINHSSTQGIAPHRESIGVNMPDRQVATVLRDEDERWRGEFGLCMERSSNRTSERCLTAS